jgi:opacity protein-like surface antigen
MQELLKTNRKLFPMRIVKLLALSCLIFSFATKINSQDIDDLLNETAAENAEQVIETFKSTHIVSGHSVERMLEGQLDFRISHRFGELNTGGYNLWGLDQANIHFGLDYGITNWLMVGVGRGTYEKTYDGLLKFSALRQSKGKKNIPVSVSLLTTSAYNSLKWEGTGELPFWDRFSYTTQILIARKFSDRLSLEINPSYVHRNIVDTELDPNDVFALGAGGRFKITKRITINAEYYYIFPPQRDFRSLTTYDPLSVGFDIETGGHVFQLHLTNSLAMIEKGFLTETTGNWLDGGIHIGFNISRTFALK